MIIYTLAFPILAGAIGYLLGVAAQHWRIESDPLVETITAMLPNAQCGQCGYPGCGEAAKAVIAGEIPPSFCPPGGNLVASQIAEKLDIPLDQDGLAIPMVAAIDPDTCDGCGRCFKTCPFDAIVGANFQLHGVVSDACTGCGQCVPVCPHNGIMLKPDPIFASVPQKPTVLSSSTSQIGVHHV
ncbi:RnfABCDGE type electron transport complex subunit B [Vibrio sp. WJH972]